MEHDASYQQPFHSSSFSIKQLCSQVVKVSKLQDALSSSVELYSLVFLGSLVQATANWPVFSKDYFWLQVCTCNAELSCSTAFPTGYASRCSSSYKSQEQLFRVHLGCSVRFQRPVYYSCVKVSKL